MGILDRSNDQTTLDPVSCTDVLLRDARHLFSAAAISGIGLWALDELTGHWTLSSEARTMLGLGAEEGLEALDLSEILLGQGRPDGLVRVSHADTGEDVWLMSVARPVIDAEGRIVRTVGILRDLTALRRSEIEQQISESRLAAALTVGRMLIWDLDIASGIVTRSANAEDLIGVRREPIVDFFARIHPEDRHRVDWETSDNPTPPQGDTRFRYRHPAGREMWLETSAVKLPVQGGLGHIIGITADVSERHRAGERLIHAANHDPLTGLLNRMAWTALLETLTTAQESVPHVLVVCDIDLFKSINDGLGHDAGDAVLLAVGERIRADLRPTAAARLGGDEFAALLPGGGDSQEVVRSIESRLHAMSLPVAVGGRDLAISISAGVVRFPEDGATANDLAKNADLALYAAKASGRKQAVQFAPTMRTAFDARMSVLSDFRDGLRAGHVIPFYQPKVSLATGRVVGFEALARWQHPERGLLTPAAFASVFEDRTLARELGRAMRAAVLADMRRWLDRGLHIGRVAVNCAGPELVDGDFGARVLHEIDAAGLQPTCFEIEVTEGVMMDRDSALVSTAMAVLRGAGVAISLDDFGTGYASLIHLRRFPVDAIKIDRSFVAEMNDSSDAAIVEAIIGMGRNLKIAVVAEGVETAGQAAALLALGCAEAQGFYFGKPMHAGRVHWFLEMAGRNDIAATTVPGMRTVSG